MLFKKVISVGILILCISSLSHGQLPFPAPSDTVRAAYADTFLDIPQLDLRLILGGSVTANTYGMLYSFPSLWIKERIKTEISVGFFWNDFRSYGLDLNPAVGARAMYYFQKHSYDRQIAVNSLYAGLSTMRTMLDYFDREITVQSTTNIVFGYSFVLNPKLQIAPEFLLGLERPDRFNPSVGVNLAFRF